jgi:hypothetical protein
VGMGGHRLKLYSDCWTGLKGDCENLGILDRAFKALCSPTTTATAKPKYGILTHRQAEGQK